MQQPAAGINLRPYSTSKHPPPPLIRAARAAWFCSGHLAVLPGRSRHVRAPLAAVAPPTSLPIIIQSNAGDGENLNTDTAEPRVEKFFEVEMSVRDCELDQYGVVNHTIYSVYIDKARERLAASLCISTGSIARTGHAMALSELNLKYMTPLRRGDRFVIKVRPVKIKGARISMKHLIETLPDRKPVLEATATVVCLDEGYRPTRVFPEMSSKLQQRFFSSSSSGMASLAN